MSAFNWMKTLNTRSPAKMSVNRMELVAMHIEKLILNHPEHQNMSLTRSASYEGIGTSKHVKAYSIDKRC